MKKLLRICPICESIEGEILYSMKFNLIDNAILPDKFDVVVCVNCGFVFNDSHATQEDYNRHYSCNSIYESDNLKGLGGSIDNNKFEEIFERIKPFLSEDISIVDVGCAQGGMLNVLKEKGYLNLHGMDLSSANLETLRRQGITPWNNSICDINIDNKFDFVILSHILEHVCDLKIAVSNLKKILNDRGFAYIEVPNADKYSEYYPEAPFHFFNIEHINHFDLNSLANLFEPYGFKFIKTFETDTIVDATIKYPVVGIVLENFAPPTLARKFSGYGCKDNIMSYIKRCRDDMDRINKIYSEIQKSKNEIIVWGAGNYAQWLIKNSLLGSCNIKFFVDKAVSKHGSLVEGFEVKSVDVLLEDKYNNENTTIVITAAVYKFEILNEIKNMKLKCLNYII